ncbi:MAG: helicase C-terminal domain-containing protein [Bacillota bacterium]|nr:helicase C-terminal domain-containing protein [Bacillota bacterium]NLJ02207.1 DEAD/DEAH box helicase family protein [Bacillota bacterium]
MSFDAEQLLGPQGLLAKTLANYEYRPEQVQMANHVYQALQNDVHGIIEAGTGVGKSLAYLLPLIEHTVAEKKRAVVATHTITLQEQLFHKDIPFLKEILPYEFKAEVFKGRHNYLCLRRWNELVQRRGSQLDLTGDFDQLSRWVNETATGDYSEAPLAIPWELWLEIRCEKESCPEELCAYFSKCFYWSLRHRLHDAHLIITNQAMLLADARTEGRVLPACKCAVIDEAHNLEDTATNAYSHQLNRPAFFAFYRTGTQLQGTLRDQVPEYVIQDLSLILDELMKEAGQYFSQIEQYMTGYTTPLTEENRRYFSQTTLPKHLKDILEVLRECSLEEEGEDAALAEQFASFADRLLTDLDLILLGHDPGYAYWAEWQNGEPTLVAAPIEVDGLLQETLFQQIPSVILTSATLSTNRSFDYIRRQLGVTEAAELILGSPFAYDKQAILCVPKEAKHPNHPRYSHYVSYLILRTLALTQGGVLALFTSYSLMDEVADAIYPKLEEVGYTLYKQGDGPRLGLIQDFQAEPRSLLFGTNSFWEGIDLPGEALRAVVITRLPFTSPDRPVTRARLQAVEAAGGNAFLEYSVPQAILRLKQGFGRLIRTKTDTGGVVILDERILTASYGADFLASLPPARFTRDLDELRLLFGN